MAVADSDKENREIMKLLVGDKSYAWVGYTDEKEEGKFVDVTTGEKMQWSRSGYEIEANLQF